MSNNLINNNNKITTFIVDIYQWTTVEELPKKTKQKVAGVPPIYLKFTEDLHFIYDNDPQTRPHIPCHRP